MMRRALKEQIAMKMSDDIELTPDEYEWLERALQWPEHIEDYDRVRKPTNLTELNPFGFVDTEQPG